MVVIIAAATNSRSNKLDVPGKALPNLDNQKNTALGAGIARHAPSKVCLGERLQNSLIPVLAIACDKPVGAGRKDEPARQRYLRLEER